MNYDKKHNNYWLRTSQLYWCIPLFYQLCIWPLCPPDLMSLVELVLISIVGLICVICFENRIGRIVAWICVGAWLVLVSLLLYGYHMDNNVSIVSVYEDMRPSYRLAILLTLLYTLLAPLFLIYHHTILKYKKGLTLSFLFVVLVICGSIYCVSTNYVLQDKLACEEYRTGKKLVHAIEEHKKCQGRYPSVLAEVGDWNDWDYKLSQNETNYTISITFEHWQDRCYRNTRVYSVETITYDSETGLWEHDRP